LEVLVRAGRKPRSALDGPDIPIELVYLWNWFMEIARTRAYNEVGPQPIGYVDVLAWATLTGREPRPHEVMALLDLDHAMLFPSD